MMENLNDGPRLRAYAPCPQTMCAQGEEKLLLMLKKMQMNPNGILIYVSAISIQALTSSLCSLFS